MALLLNSADFADIGTTGVLPKPEQCWVVEGANGAVSLKVRVAVTWFGGRATQPCRLLRRRRGRVSGNL